MQRPMQSLTKKLRRNEKLNSADQMIFQTEKQLKEFGEKLSKENKSNIESSHS